MPSQEELITKEQQIKAKKRTKIKENTKLFFIVFITLIIILGLMGLAIYVMTLADDKDNGDNGNDGGNGVALPDNYVTNVIDGDTFELANGDKVRLICVDAPELGKTGTDESKEFLEILILNKDVRLEKDVDNRDEYGRLLRYVYVNGSSGDEIFVNKEMMSNAPASVFRYGNNTRLCDEIESG